MRNLKIDVSLINKRDPVVSYYNLIRRSSFAQQQKYLSIMFVPSKVALHYKFAELQIK